LNASWRLKSRLWYFVKMQALTKLNKSWRLKSRLRYFVKMQALTKLNASWRSPSLKESNAPLKKGSKEQDSESWLDLWVMRSKEEKERVQVNLVCLCPW
jgi:hypothetical protein